MFRPIRRFLVALAVLALGSTPASAQLVRSTSTTTATTYPSSSTTSTSTTTVTTATSLLTQAAEFTLTELSVVAPPCSEAKLTEIFEDAEDAVNAGRAPVVTVDCSFSFSAFPRDRITKKLLFTGSTRGVTVDCQGGPIDGGPGSYLYENGDRGVNIVEIVSSYNEDSAPLRWTARPQDITIRDCEIIGSARIWPFNFWVPGNLERQAVLSRQPGYVATLRANAPRGIRFQRIHFSAQKHSPLYIGAGVTETEVSDSYFDGGAEGVILYLDAESSRNVIRGNQFHAESDLGADPREILAIDGSDHNRIVGNYFSALDHGGIYLYRNCGEGNRAKEIGVVRFTTPSHNQIINNVFYNAYHDGPEAAIVLGSRNGENAFHQKDKTYCDHDADFAGGSGADDRSFATHNVVMQNQFYRRSLASSVVTPWADVNGPNYVAYNEDRLVSHQERPSGCYVDTAYGQFLRDGETTRLLRSSTGAPTCSSGKSRCDDGELVVDPASLVSCQIDRIPFACSTSGNNAGCSSSTICPSGTKLVRTVAACNLEYGSVASTDVGAISVNAVRVVRASDDVDSGSCRVGSASISSGEAVIEREISGGRVYFGCSEYDENGGDCHVRGELYCQNERLLTSSTLSSGALLTTSGTR